MFLFPSLIQKNINIKELRICEGDSEKSFTQYQGCTFHKVGEFILFIDGSLALRPMPGHSRIQQIYDDYMKKWLCNRKEGREEKKEGRKEGKGGGRESGY